MKLFVEIFATPIIVLAWTLGLWVSACGPSMVQQHTTAISAIASVTAVTSDVVSAAVSADAEATCPDTQDDAADRACISTLRERWAPVDTTFSSVRLALVVWLEAVALAANREELWAAALQAAQAFLVEWNSLAVALAAHHVTIPAIPPLALGVFGGES